MYFQRKEAEIPNTVDSEIEEGVPVLGDILEHAYYFEQANVGIGREETFRIFLALKQLSDSYLFKVCRFWGRQFLVSTQIQSVECPKYFNTIYTQKEHSYS